MAYSLIPSHSVPAVSTLPTLRQGSLLAYFNQTVLLPTNPVMSHNFSMFSSCWYCVHVSLMVGSALLPHICLAFLNFGNFQVENCITPSRKTL